MILRTYLVTFAVLVAAVVALYPSLAIIGHCDHGGGCPYVARSSPESSHTSSTGLVAMCLSAMLAGSAAAMLALATFYGGRITLTVSRPEDVFLSPDPPPPRYSLSHQAVSS